MKQPEAAQKKTRGTEYPDISTWDVVREYLLASRFYWGSGLCMVLGWIIATLFQSILVPVYYKNFFDTIAGASPAVDNLAPKLLTIIIYVLILNCVVWIGFRMGGFGANYFFTKVMRRLGRDAFSGLLEHSHSFFSNHFSGGLTQKVNRYVKTFSRFADNIVGDVVPLVVKVVGAIVILYIVEPKIALVIFLWILLYLFASFCFAKYKLKYDVQVSSWETKYTGAIADAVSNHDSVQLFTGEGNEVSRFNKVSNELMDFMVHRWNVGSVIDAIQSLLTIGIEFVIFYYGIKYWQMGLVSIGTFALIQAYVISIGGSLWGFSRVIRSIYESVADAKEMVEILHLEHGIQDIPNARQLVVEKGGIEYKNVSFAFGQNKPVFTNMNISIKPGEKVALIGSSGAGKSTLVKLLLRLYDIQQGEIIIDGQNIKEVTQASLRENISLVPQDPALFHRSLMENIRYGKRDATDAEVIEASRLAHCDIFINEFPQKYETFVGERGVKLSGGERQRVAIARAILKNAPVLVLDEATSSLDSHSESLIQDALHTLMKGKTTVVIAHRLSTIRNMDRIIVVSKGGVVEEGSHEELLKKTNGIYAKLWSLQAGGFSHKSIEELLEV